MTIQMPAITAAPKQRKTQLITATVGAVLALATAAGIGAWQAGRDGGASVGEQSATAMPAPVQRAVGRTADVAPRIYLAGTQAEADALRTTLDDDAARTEAVNMLPAAASAVTVIETEDEHMRLLQLVGAADAVTAALGLPLLQVVDRRAS